MKSYLAQAQNDGTGNAVVRISHNLSGIIWEVQQITGYIPSNELTSQIGIYINGSPVAPAAALTTITGPLGSSVNCQTFGGQPYLYLFASDEIEVICSGLTNANSTLSVRAQYKEMLQATFEAIGY